MSSKPQEEGVSGRGYEHLCQMLLKGDHYGLTEQEI